MNSSIPITKALRATTSRHGWIGLVLFPLALLKIVFYG